MFERRAYVVQFDVVQEHVEEALNQRLHIISLDSSSAANRDDVLTRFLAEIQGQLDTKAGVNLRGSRPDLFEDVESDLVQKAVLSPEQSPVIETTSRLCFVMMPFSKRFDEVYRLLIAPVALDNGLTVLRADEMGGPGFIWSRFVQPFNSRDCA
jgi:hypothetical protein